MEKFNVEETRQQENHKVVGANKKVVLKNKMLLATLVGVLTGIVLGFSLRPLELHQDSIQLVGYPGELFIRLLKLIILPLIITSLIAGTSSLNAKMNGQIAIRTLIFFCSTSFFNAVMGTLLVVLIRPGEIAAQDHQNDMKPTTMNATTNLLDSILDLGRNLIPDNLFQAAFESTQTVYVENTNPFRLSNDSDLVKAVKYRPGTNTLGIVFFCALFGTVLGCIGERGKEVTELFQTTFEVIMKMVTGIMWLTPIGVGSVIAGKILSVANVGQVISQLAWFVVTVSIGLFIFHFIVLQLIYFVILRKNPFKFYLMLLHPMLTAAACASTAAALPLTFRVMDTEIKIDPRITKFVLPIGCNTNTDGTAVMISVSSIFIAQMNGISLQVGEIFAVCLLSFTSSMAVSSVPSSALIMIILVLTSMGVPTQDVSLLFAIDWFVDRLRTSNNMLSDCYAAAVVEHLSKDALKAMDEDKKVVHMETAQFDDKICDE